MDRSISRARYMTRSRSGSMFLPSLPEEMIIEILAKLPVKSVVRFRVVCKRWSSLTRKPSFIRKHLRNCNANGINWDVDHTFEINLPSSRNISGFRWGIFTFLPRGLASLYRERPSVIVGYCDGLLCSYMPEDDHLSVSLCNPALRESRDLPLCHSDRYSHKKPSRFVFGLGIDPNAEDYKVVGLVELGTSVDGKSLNCAEVYSQSTGNWRVLDHAFEDAALQNVFFPRATERIALYTGDGALHWSLLKRGEHSGSKYEAILSFDLKNEVFRLTEFPEKYNEFNAVSRTPRREHSVNLLHGKLALLCSFFDFDGSQTSIDVWVMENNAGEDSWSHTLTVDPIPGFCYAMCFWRNSELVIVKGYADQPTFGWPYLCDPTAKKIKELKLSGGFEFIYRESLVPMKRGRIRLNSYGSKEGEFCIAGYGGVIRDEEGIWIKGYCGQIGMSSVLEAELWGIHRGMVILHEERYSGAIVETDSQEAIKHINEESPPNFPYKALVQEIRILRDGCNLELNYIPRLNNGVADTLAKMGRQQSETLKIFEEPPQQIAGGLVRETS